LNFLLTDRPLFAVEWVSDKDDNNIQLCQDLPLRQRELQPNHWRPATGSRWISDRFKKIVWWKFPDYIV